MSADSNRELTLWLEIDHGAISLRCIAPYILLSALRFLAAPPVMGKRGGSFRPLIIAYWYNRGLNHITDETSSLMKLLQEPANETIDLSHSGFASV